MKIVTPETTQIRLERPDGTVLLDEDLVILDLLMGEAQRKYEGTDKYNEFLKEFQDLLAPKIVGPDITITEVYVLVKHMERLGVTLKKSIEHSQNLLEPMDSPTKSRLKNTAVSTSTSRTSKRRKKSNNDKPKVN